MRGILLGCSDEGLLGERQDCFWWSQRIGLKRGGLNVVGETDFGVEKQKGRGFSFLGDFGLVGGVGVRRREPAQAI